MKVKRTLIIKDVKLSPREKVDSDVVGDYVDCYEQLPPIVVFKTPGKSKYLLADGWHRIAAAERLGLEEVEADVKYGSRDNAKEHALLANLRHGRPLTREEKRHVIAEFLKLHPERSNNWIAEDLGISKNTANTIREELEEGCQIDRLPKLMGKDGIEYPRTIQQPKQEVETPEQEIDASEQETEPEDAPEPKEEVPAVPMLGPFKLNDVHQADCVEAFQRLPEASVDLVFSDPKYNLGKKYGGSGNDRMPTADYFKWCMQWFLGVYRALKPGGAFYVMHYPEVAARWKQQLDDLMTFQRWITWVYPQNVGHSKDNWTRAQRTILYYIKSDTPAYFNGLADPQPYKNPDDVRIKHRGQPGVTPYDWWEFNLVKNVSKSKTSWPNQLPVPLVQRIVVTSCPEGGIVCDPSMGSGTTAEAAIRTRRDWIGFDIEARACEITRKRRRGCESDLGRSP